MIHEPVPGEFVRHRQRDGCLVIGKQGGGLDPCLVSLVVEFFS